jgi:hypothetical protein
MKPVTLQEAACATGVSSVKREFASSRIRRTVRANKRVIKGRLEASFLIGHVLLLFLAKAQASPSLREARAYSSRVERVCQSVAGAGATAKACRSAEAMVFQSGRPGAACRSVAAAACWSG